MVSILLPSPKPAERRGIFEPTTRGIRIYLATPRLRGLLALSMAVSAGGAMVIVNTVVIVQSGFGLTQQATAVALAAFGGGSMASALVPPRLLDTDRGAMLAGGLLVSGLVAPGCQVLLGLWLLLGFGTR